jgi:hypothetical protein
MAITVSTAMPTSFKVELLKAVHDFTASTGNTFKLALLKATAAGSGTFGTATTNLSDLGSDQLDAGSGYTSGGNTLVSITPVADGTTAVCDFDNTTFSAATFITCGALIYNDSASGAAVAVLSFGGDQQVSSGDFSIQFPTAAAATAIIRIA